MSEEQRTSNEEVSQEEWLNQRLANSRIHNSQLEQRIAQIRRDVEEICQQRATSPVTRSRLRHALAGVDWRKAK